MTPDEIVAVLRAERQRLGWSMRQVGAHLGHGPQSRNVVYDWERGAYLPHLSTAARWAGALGLQFALVPSPIRPVPRACVWCGAELHNTMRVYCGPKCARAAKHGRTKPIDPLIMARIHVIADLYGRDPRGILTVLGAVDQHVAAHVRAWCGEVRSA